MAAIAAKLLKPLVILVGLSSSWKGLAPLQAWSSDDGASLQAIEKEMAERPQDALTIARRAPFADDDIRKRLFALAARYQEPQLKNLSEAQVVDLAKVYESELGDSKAGLRVLLGWLRQRARSPEEVRRLLGQPKRVSWQILYRHQIEQWAYENPAPLRIDFDCIKGQDPRLLSVHSVNSKGH